MIEKDCVNYLSWFKFAVFVRYILLTFALFFFEYNFKYFVDVFYFFSLKYLIN